MGNLLKSVDGPLGSLFGGSLFGGAGSVSLPPPDGADLQAVYDAESRHMRRMRAGEADALWYDWVPARSLSGSRRELSRLGDVSRFDDEPVAVRGTGGKIVPQGPGLINISVLSRHPDHPGIRAAYDAVCAALIQGFAAMGLATTTGARAGSFCDGAHNVLLATGEGPGRKLVGTAQRWARWSGGAVCLHHCVILSGGRADELCARAEALYAHAGLPERYSRDAHSEVVLDRGELRAAMAGPLGRYLDAAEAGRI